MAPTLLKKPKKSGSEYYCYKGFFSLLLPLFLFGTDYRLIWVDVVSGGSLSDVQICNCSKLKKKIEDGSLGLPAPDSLGDGGTGLFLAQ